ncbi:MAG: hypothetical protein WCN98_01215 [Verrucomicrobiaceae bacterium]
MPNEKCPGDCECRTELVRRDFLRMAGTGSQAAIEVKWRQAPTAGGPSRGFVQTRSVNMKAGGKAIPSTLTYQDGTATVTRVVVHSLAVELE